MYYDPLKNKLAGAISLFPGLRMLFYKAMDALLLRQAYVKREIWRYKQIATPLRFYDAGAGFCQYSWFVLRHIPASIVHATDLKSDYLRDFAHLSAQHFPDRFSYHTADLQTYKTSQQCDIAIAIDILEHIPDDVAAIDNFHQSLTSGGVLIISTPSDQDEAARFTEEHVRPGYNKAALEGILKTAGFEILTSIYTYGTWGALSWKLCIKFPMMLLAAHKALALFLPFWYLFTYPLSLLLMKLDMRTCNPTGTGILIVARKSLTNRLV